MPKRKTSAKSKKSPDPPAKLSPAPSLVVSDDKSTLGQVDRDPSVKEGQADLTSEEQTDKLCNYYVHLCGISVQFKLQISHLKSLSIIHDANSNSLLKMIFSNGTSVFIPESCVNDNPIHHERPRTPTNAHE